ncbi:MAG: CocE/NonD family hydrolase [Bacteroidia bacterium]|nr:MAG: CocE/NonD family hydrolase [Bacteroidia bacterium]
MKNRLTFLFIVIFLVIPQLRGQETNFVEENYIKNEYQIEMRDGVKLFTIVYSPKDKSEKYPFLMQRTPYSIGPYGEKIRGRLSSNDRLEKDLYIFVFQDVRGAYMSEGKFVDMRPVLGSYESVHDVDETTDTWDTVEWLINNIDNNNGKVGMYGTSYPGFYAVMGSIHAHPAMVCTSPQAPISDWFLWDDMHHNGAFTLPLCFNFFQSFGQDRPEPTTSRAPRMQYPSADAYHFFLDLGPVKNINENYLKGSIDFWNKFIQHPDYDSFWQARSTLPHLKDITPAVLTVGGWYDGEDLSGALHTYKTIEANNPDADNMLVMGPWTHGGWGYPDYNDPSRIPFREKDKYFYLHEIEYPFFSHYLKGKGKHKLPDAWVFDTGSDEWRSYESWPPEKTTEKNLWLDEDGALSWTAPGRDGEAYDEFISDPSKPVPYTAPFLSARSFYNRQYLSEDQRFASSRTDVLVYKGEEIEEDITLTGPVEVELFVSTTGTDADWVLKLIDVFPDDADQRGLNQNDIEVGGYQMLVRGDIFRGKYRNSFEHPEPFTPSEVTNVKFVLPDLNHTFQKGHKIMVQIQSSWFPLFDRNPQTFTNIYLCGEEAFQKARHRVYRTAEHPTHLKFQILPQ